MGTMDRWLGWVLVGYLLIVGVTAAMLIVVNFPNTTSGDFEFSDAGAGGPEFFPFGPLRGNDQGFLLLAFCAGVTGSFLHAAQSLSTYLGNASFKASWSSWYVLRPWIGGLLGFALYFSFRAGLVAGASVVNPYGVIAIGTLAGWFSKTTTDKLQEVFETLFKTDEDRKRKDKLEGPLEAPMEAPPEAPE